MLRSEKLLYFLRHLLEVVALLLNESVVCLLLLFDLGYLCLYGVEIGVEPLNLVVELLFLLIELRHFFLMVLFQIIKLFLLLDQLVLKCAVKPQVSLYGLVPLTLILERHLVASEVVLDRDKLRLLLPQL